MVRIGVDFSAEPAFSMSTRNSVSPSVFFFTSSNGVVRAISRYMCDWRKRDVQTFWPLMT